MRSPVTLVAVLALGLWWSRAIVLWTTTGLSAVLALVALPW